MILTTGLRKSFTFRRGRGKPVHAVRGIDLAVQPREIFGVLGPNGAGKTTTLRMLATLIRPDGGRAEIAGVDLLTDPGEVRRRIGYVAQGGGTTDGVSAREELVMQARMYGIAKTEAADRAQAAVDAFGLAEFGDRHCKTYSGGQRRRVDLALGVIHRPRLLFLDEPTVGLDPQSRSQVWAEVRRLRDEGMTVLLCTHYLDEADGLCDRVGIVDHGRVVAEGTPEQLKKEISGDAVGLTLHPAELGGAEAVLRELSWVNRLERVPGAEDTSGEARDAGELRVYVPDAAAALPQLLRVLQDAGVDPVLVQLRRPSLDDVFLARTGRSLDLG
ncbi:daunorubicin resistance protein DrrA family ABC transporter ATP-binding protein [Streptomyces pluripotens]|uniref:Daunorubicin resistance protein DrrA family ABC transporter ATP-binding protein n=1 Tax=Streptomyces pluripotens TaxID=1355015 RepID=A0A221P7L5_9ACTN|nr:MULTISPECIES: daunorubicin resistance protein DrrA family ABC transporter ATP-binding protein [Streptomyces]ARP73752.1 daunorubicin resistance protein DrrA family ABC transporter ATP-binding protein [Streptomyces pluripotens]ASN27998.1 daunorubicin resistance protein DrrA family ABC transporter ATP-binding protein [Streptomyces pluripotens]KIE27912.1 ABC transporter [Streptomyces sp. MUSC 125]